MLFGQVGKIKAEYEGRVSLPVKAFNSDTIQLISIKLL
jgi:hypothetical protein